VNLRLRLLYDYDREISCKESMCGSFQKPTFLPCIEFVHANSNGRAGTENHKGCNRV
jgi:hypothetical protein